MSSEPSGNYQTCCGIVSVVEKEFVLFAVGTEFLFAIHSILRL